MLPGILAQSALALSLISLGWWGRRRAATLVPASLASANRARRIVTVRRGATACLVLGALFALATIPANVWHAIFGYL
jgi:hypothetical protein